MGAQIRQALATELEDLAMLGARRDFDLLLAGKHRDFQLSPQGGLRERDGDLADQIIVMALEELVGLDDDVGMQIARRAAAHARLALAAQDDRLALARPR